MLLGESIVTPNSRRIPCNQTHCVATLTDALYSASAEERKMAYCFLLDQKIGPSASMKPKPQVEFMSLGSPTQSELGNPTSSSEELAA